jgi:hypothetical protein
MLQGWSMEERIDAHRRDLLADAVAHRSRSRVKPVDEVQVAPLRSQTAQLSATGLPVSGGRTVRRSGLVSQRFGSWLIHAGTRLGGGSMRTSS